MQLKRSPAYMALYAMYNQLVKRDNANLAYEDAIILLDNLLSSSYRFESTEIQAAISMLEKLPAYGACARNFRNRYLKDEYTLRSLPKDPKKLPKGHWH